MPRHRSGGVRTAALVAASLVAAAAACGADDPLSDPVPTVPSVTTVATSAADVSSAAPDADVVDLEQPDKAPVVPTTTPDFGDLRKVEIDTEPVLTLERPIDMAIAPGDDLAWVADWRGRVLRVDLDVGEAVETVLDISAETTTSEGERGLLGLAVTRDWLFINYTDLNGDTRIDAFERSGNGLSGRRRLLLTQEQPNPNHNGGGIEIGPDGYLYIGLGDGGSSGDPLDSGQDRFSWLGAILRIDPTPDADQPYAIPPDNPYADGVGGRPEIFLTGVRNPWRFSFDTATGDLWVADVGQDAFEEVTLLLADNRGGAGANLGWRLREGLHEFSGDRPPGNVDPVYEYSHDQGCAVIGGHVYRGSAIPDLVGAYVFGDRCTLRVWAISTADGAVYFRDLGADVTGGDLVSFGRDRSGELYTLSLSGPIARIVPNGEPE